MSITGPISTHCIVVQNSLQKSDSLPDERKLTVAYNAEICIILTILQNSDHSMMDSIVVTKNKHEADGPDKAGLELFAPLPVSSVQSN